MRIASFWPGLVLLCAASFCGDASAAALKTIYKFCSASECPDGQEPSGPVIADESGNLYGTAGMGGEHGNGVVFELVADAARTHWTQKVLYSFCKHFPQCTDGAQPDGGVIRDVNGNLYGVTQSGGRDSGGVFYELLSGNGGADWTYRQLYAFGLGSALTYAGAETGALYDGLSPLYGVGPDDSPLNNGAVFELSRRHGQWQRNVIYDFSSDGSSAPSGPLLYDAGSLYGVTASGGPNDGGTVYQLAEAAHRKWTYTRLYTFGPFNGADASFPVGPLVRDEAGQFYGTSAAGGKTSQGTLFSLSVGDGGTSDLVLNSFCDRAKCKRGAEPNSGVLIGADGTLFGTAPRGGDSEFVNNGAGTVYAFRDGETNVLHTFCRESGCPDGDLPLALTMDGQGNLFGVTSDGGESTFAGTVFEITP